MGATSRWMAVLLAVTAEVADCYSAGAGVPLPRGRPLSTRHTALGAAGSTHAAQSSTARSSIFRCVLDVSLDACTAGRPDMQEGCGSLFDRFVRTFAGHFDNREQALADRIAGTPPRQGGGHEHIHCHLQPLSVRRANGAAHGPIALLATYHFAGAGPKPFRQRVYTLRPLAAWPGLGEVAPGEPAIEMQIFRLTEDAEAQLLASGGDASCLGWEEERHLSQSLLIRGCDVLWHWTGDHFEGDMVSESAIVASPILNADIVVRDHLTLLGDALWVNDRGWDLQGNYLYGNIHDIPYKMDRVGWAACESAWA